MTVDDGDGAVTVTVDDGDGGDSAYARSFCRSHAESERLRSACDARATMGFGSINLGYKKILVRPGYKKILVRPSIVASNSGQLIVQQ